MIERVLLVAWKGSPAAQWLETLRAGGYTVLLEDTTGERAWRTAKERGIQAVIIDGLKKPTHGRQTGHALRDTRKTEKIPIIWTNLGVEDAATVQREVSPDVTLDAPTDAAQALEALNALAARHAQDNGEQKTSPAELVDPTLHSHIHSLMGTPAYLAEWTERPEPKHHFIDPHALPPPIAAATPPTPPAPKEAKRAPAAKAPSAAKKAAAKPKGKAKAAGRATTLATRPKATAARKSAARPAPKR